MADRLLQNHILVLLEICYFHSNFHIGPDPHALKPRPIGK
jgi:hypothetical protein